MGQPALRRRKSYRSSTVQTVITTAKRVNVSGKENETNLLQGSKKTGHAPVVENKSRSMIAAGKCVCFNTLQLKRARLSQDLQIQFAKSVHFIGRGGWIGEWRRV